LGSRYRLHDILPLPVTLNEETEKERKREEIDPERISLAT
jgi:hypothetical protein